MDKTRQRSLRNYYIGFGVLLQTTGLLGLIPAHAGDRISQALEAPFPYEGREMTAQTTLTDFGRHTGLPVFADDVSGTVTIENGRGTAETFLNAFAAQTASTWWSDGASIRIEPQTTIQRRVYAEANVAVEELRDAVTFLGLSAGPDSIQMSPRGRLVVVTGPASFVVAVEDVITQLNAALEAERVGLPNVIKGRVPRAATVAQQRVATRGDDQSEGTLQ